MSLVVVTKYSVILGGFLSFALAIFHCFFYHYFKWKDDLKDVSVLNAKIFITLHIAVIAVFMFFAFLSFVYTEELSQCSGLAGAITGFYAFVWLFRTIWQVTYLKHLKNEKPLLYCVLNVWFITLFVLYSIPVVIKMF